MIKVAAAMLLLLGSGLIFKALVEMDGPTLRLLKRRALPEPGSRQQEPTRLRRAA
jgi:hypothetical protein